MHGRPEPGRSVRQGCVVAPRIRWWSGLPAGPWCKVREARYWAGASPGVYSARLHSRGIDSIRRGRPLVPFGGGKSGRHSRKPRNQEVAPGAPCLTDHPDSGGKLDRGLRRGRGSTSQEAGKSASRGRGSDHRLLRPYALCPMPYASPTGPAQADALSDIMKTTFSATC
jgi:hypothetical protein